MRAVLCLVAVVVLKLPPVVIEIFQIERVDAVLKGGFPDTTDSVLVLVFKCSAVSFVNGFHRLDV